MDIKEALATLDPKNDEHWTGDGLPRVEVVAKLVGTDLKRADITDADPKFTRGSGLVQDDEDEEEAEVEEVVELQSVLDLPIADVLKDLNLIEAANEELSQKDLQIIRQVEALKKEREQIAAKTGILDRARRRLSLNQRDPNTKNIQNYLAAQNKARAERAARAKRFIDAGTTPGDVGKQLAGTSPLDASMARKNSRGTKRPTRDLIGS